MTPGKNNNKKKTQPFISQQKTREVDILSYTTLTMIQKSQWSL